MLSIRQMQTNLKHYKGYYTGLIDGIIGVQSRSAVKKFQKEFSLTQDGIYGPDTDGKLISVIKQCQKKCGAAADGIVGQATVSAIKSYQRANGLPVTGVFDSKTLAKMGLFTLQEAIDWSKVKYFKKSEFKCDCGGRFCNGYPAQIDKDLIRVLERMRKNYGAPIRITSGVRCRKRNAELSGSSPVSRHLIGKAADVWIVGTAANNEALVKWCRKQPEVNYSYTGFGAVHVDVK